jgi:hypothetical protein
VVFVLLKKLLVVPAYGQAIFYDPLAARQPAVGSFCLRKVVGDEDSPWFHQLKLVSRSPRLRGRERGDEKDGQKNSKGRFHACLRVSGEL